MELKYKFLNCFGEIARSSNRTFMELKCRYDQAAQCKSQVLIVPLWN